MSWSNKYKRSINCDNPSGFSQKAHCAARKKRAKGEETKSKSPFNEMNNPRIPKKPGQPDKSDKHSDLYTDEDPKGTIHGLGFKDVATAKQSVSKIRNSGRSHAHKIQAAIAMEQRARVMGKTSEAAIFRKFINSMKKKTEEMNEEKNKCKPGNYYCFTDKKCKPIPFGYMVGRDGMLDKEDDSEGNGSNGNGSSISEEGLRDWFGKSKSKDGKGGWVNVVTGGTCASDEPGEGTPKCVSSAKRASMTKAERLSAARRKKAADPGQQAKTGAAKPTYVSTDSPKKKIRKEDINLSDYFELTNNIILTHKVGQDLQYNLIEKNNCNNTKKGINCPCHGKERCPVVLESKDHEYSMARSELSTIISAAKKLKKKMAKGEGNIEAWVQSKITKAADYIDSAADYVDSGEMNEEADKKGKGSGTKDACYHKVKSRYSVWPSAYASGALVKCRKVGAANWGNKSESYTFSNWKDNFLPTEIETINIINPEPLKPSGSKEEQLDEAGKKCWPGYEKKGTQKLFGKTYNRCVKKEQLSNWRSELGILELLEDWQSKNRKDGVDGLSQSTVDAYRRENPGSKLQTAVTEKKPTGKRAERRKSFCRRMKGMKSKLTSAKTARDPDSRINKALRRWNCN